MQYSIYNLDITYHIFEDIALYIIFIDGIYLGLNLESMSQYK